MYGFEVLKSDNEKLVSLICKRSGRVYDDNSKRTEKLYAVLRMNDELMYAYYKSNRYFSLNVIYILKDEIHVSMRSNGIMVCYRKSIEDDILRFNNMNENKKVLAYYLLDGIKKEI